MPVRGSPLQLQWAMIYASVWKPTMRSHLGNTPEFELHSCDTKKSGGSSSETLSSFASPKVCMTHPPTHTPYFQVGKMSKSRMLLPRCLRPFQSCATRGTRRSKQGPTWVPGVAFDSISYISFPLLNPHLANYSGQSDWVSSHDVPPFLVLASKDRSQFSIRVMST